MTTLTRAEVLTGTTKKTEFFSDFLNSFAKSPVGNQLARVTNEKSVNQSLKNLILTNLGERFFQPNIGSNVYNTLFEPNFQESMGTLELYIQNTIKNNEPRVNLINVRVTNIFNVNSVSKENELEITIFYNLINNPEPINLSFILKRVR